MTQNPNLVRATLELLILKSLTWEPRHGYGIADWIQTVTDGTLLMEEGTLYPALHRLHGRELIESEWGLSENNRRAKYYSLTTAGSRHLSSESESWTRYTNAVARALATEKPAG
ncbi:MAG: PadR family transcriptional regulator [Gemmatimonadota bacterium]